MQSLFHLFAIVWEPTAMALALVFAYGMISRSRLSQQHTTLITGATFGGAAVIAMLVPIQLGDGVIVDLRTLFVGMGAAFFGPAVGFIALGVAGLGRIIIGGSGTIPGLIALSLACLAALCWRKWVRPRMTNEITTLLVLGSMLCVNQLAVFTLPAEIQHTFWVEIAPWLSLSHVVGAILLGKMILRENKLTFEMNELRDAVRHDPLTNLINREALVSMYEMTPRPDIRYQGTAMLCIDVDNFKQVNDTYGHLAGDEVLVEVANRMSDCLRPDDIFARVSGDEFIIVLNDLTDENARSVANRCQKAIEERPMIVKASQIKASVSIGCTWTATRPPFVELRLAADAALYQAKEAGRNCVAFERIKDMISPAPAGSEPMPS